MLATDTDAPKNSPATAEIKTEAETKKKPSRRPLYIVGAIIALGAILGAAYWLYTRQYETTDDAFIEGNIVQINSKISSHIVKIQVRENQFVKKGDLLIELDPRDAEVKLEQARAHLKLAEAQREKARAEVSLTGKTSRGNLKEASSNFQTARAGVEQSRFFSDSKQTGIEQARNQYKIAEANLRQIQAQIPAAEAALAQAQAKVPAAQTKFDLARADYERYQNLFEKGDVSRQRLDQARRDLSDAESEAETARRQVDIAQSQLNALRRQSEAEAFRVRESESSIVRAENDYRQSQAQIKLSGSQAEESAGRLQQADAVAEQIAVEQTEVEAAEAQIFQAQAAVNQAELELSYAKIYAPDDGFVTRKAVQEGQLVQSEQALMAISQPGIWVVANFKETQIGKMRVGQTVDVYVDAFPGEVFRGKIESFQAGTGSRFSVLPADNAGGNFVKVVQRIPVKIVFEESPERIERLVPGMSVVPRVRL
jgi:membrane fusion protein, multidrug efflux system